jgi:hypothetical protein
LTAGPFAIAKTGWPRCFLAPSLSLFDRVSRIRRECAG